MTRGKHVNIRLLIFCGYTFIIIFIFSLPLFQLNILVLWSSNNEKFYSTFSLTYDECEMKSLWWLNTILYSHLDYIFINSGITHFFPQEKWSSIHIIVKLLFLELMVKFSIHISGHFKTVLNMILDFSLCILLLLASVSHQPHYRKKYKLIVNSGSDWLFMNVCVCVWLRCIPFTISDADIYHHHLYQNTLHFSTYKNYVILLYVLH